MQGEHRVARTRLALVAVLTLVGLGVVLRDPSHADFIRAIPISLVVSGRGSRHIRLARSSCGR